MSDVFTHVSHNSLGDNLFRSIKGFLVGVVLFLVAFPILWVNEGLTDMSTVAKTATVVAPASPGSTGEGKLIAATGNLATAAQVGDPDRLAPGNYVKVHRKVESYVWKEKKDSHTEKTLGGGSRTVTTYTYDLTWTDSPQDSKSFEHEDGHENPPVTLKEDNLYAAKANVGALEFDPSQAELPAATPLALTPALLDLPKPAPPPAPVHKPAGKGKKAEPAPTPAPVKAASEEDFRFASGFLYRGVGNPTGPQLGDVRVSYEAVVPGAQVTLYGERHGNQVAPFVKDGDRLYRAVAGTHEQAMSTMHGEHVALTWMLRIVGVFCMWIGLALLLAPFNAVLDIIPFIGSAGRFVTGLLMFPVALIVSSIVIVIAIVAHSPILLLLTLLAVVGGGIFYVRARKKAAQNKAPQAAAPVGQYGGPPGGQFGPPAGQFGPPPGGGGFGPPPGGGGGYGPPGGGGGYGPPGGGGGYGPPGGGGGYGPPGGGGGYGPPGGGGPPYGR